MFTPWITAVALASIRIGVALFALYPFSMLGVPKLARALLALTLGACIASGGPAVTGTAFGPAWIAAAAVREAAIGLSLAFGLIVAFAAFAVGGRLLDYQIGFGIAEIVDPASRTQVPLLGFLLQLLGAAVFFALEGHHGLLRALSASWTALPPGLPALSDQPLQLAGSFAAAFACGLAVVAPVVALLALLDAGMALLSRVLPQMNVLMMSMGLKALVAVGALALSMRFAGGALVRVLTQAAPSMPSVH
jgi:flagellar biosynthetic protein FliR